MELQLNDKQNMIKELKALPKNEYATTQLFDIIEFYENDDLMEYFDFELRVFDAGSVSAYINDYVLPDVIESRINEYQDKALDDEKNGIDSFELNEYKDTLKWRDELEKSEKMFYKELCTERYCKLYYFDDDDLIAYPVTNGTLVDLIIKFLK